MLPVKNRGQKNVKNLLESLGFNDVWLFQGVGNVNSFIKIFTQRLNDNFIKKWHENIDNSTRAKSYKLF